LRVLVVTNMYPTRQDPSVGVVVERQVQSLRELGLEVDVLHFDRRSRGRQVYWRLGHALRQAVERVQPDLVHVTYGGVTAYLATRAVRDRPVVVYFRGSDLLGSPAEALARRFTIHLGVIASRIAAARAAAAIVDSENLRAALPSGAAGGNVWIVPSGIDLVRFAPLDRERCRAQLGWAADRHHVLFPAPASRPEKRYALAEAAVARLGASGFEVDLHELDGIQHTEVPTWMNASDVVLLTSTHEGSPNAVKEALACNVPVVAVDVGDVRQRLADVSGCYVAAPTTNDLAEKLGLVLAGGGRVDARSTLVEISLEKTAQRLLDIYRATVAKTGKGATMADKPGNH
jgi:glycosyltransferase involved in cell wall biosynthesis